MCVTESPLWDLVETEQEGQREREQRQKGSFDGKLRSELGGNRGHD